MYIYYAHTHVYYTYVVHVVYTTVYYIDTSGYLH